MLDGAVLPPAGDATPEQEMWAWASNVFDIIWMMTRGGPGVSTTTVPVLMYDTAFYGYNISKASAGAIIFLLLLIIFAIVFIFLNRKQFILANETFKDLSK